jgi:nucleobase:cation symporter-1, NCS1 family
LISEKDRSMSAAAANHSASNDGIQELTVDLSNSPYFSPDMGPVNRAGRRWGMKDIAVLWISMSACVTTYTLASQRISEGMNWWQAVLTIFLGNVIVLIPMVLNAHAGTKYGIPFPVYCRASFGIRGANVPAMLRALVACGWFGIQTWIGGWAIYMIGTVFIPAWEKLPILFADPAVPGSGLGINAAQLGCFLFFWAINLLVIYLGIESIRILLNIKAPILIAGGLALLAWAYEQKGFGPILSQKSLFDPGGTKRGQFWIYFFPALTGAVGYWATLSLNIPDFSRYAKTQRDQVWGQAIGLPTTMALYSFIGVAVTSAAVLIYPNMSPDKLWDPIVLISMFKQPAVLVVGLFVLTLATLATNIAANVVSPANDFAHLWPRRISFRIGGFITGIIGVLIQPWRLYNDPHGYVFKWLIAYSALLGSVGGVLIADYYVLRRTQLNQAGLYQKEGPYWYRGGFNLLAIVALVLGIAPCVPGFLNAVGLVALQKDATVETTIPIIADIWGDLYHYTWFISFGISFVLYMLLMLLFSRRRTSATS